MILVTGATGKIGSEVVRLLARAGVSARALVRDTAKTRTWSEIEIVKGDLDVPASVVAALHGVDTVFLLSVANLEHELGVIEASKEAGVKKIVKLSGMGADINSPLTITRRHGLSENRLIASGLSWTILRPGYFTQNFLNFATTIREQGKFFGSVKDGKIVPIDTRDIAEVAAATLTSSGHDGSTYVLTGTETISYAEAAAKISSAIGKSVTYVDIPLEETRKGLEGSGFPQWLVEDFIIMEQSIASGRAVILSKDFEKVTGHKPRVFDEFARDYAASFQLASGAAHPQQ